MKTNFKRISKKTLSVVIVAMMVLSTMLVGMVSANALSSWAIVGDFNSWSTTSNTINGSSGSVEIDLSNYKGKTFKFKAYTYDNSDIYCGLASGTTISLDSRQKLGWGTGDVINFSVPSTGGNTFVFTIDQTNSDNYIKVTQKDSSSSSTTSSTTTTVYVQKGTFTGLYVWHGSNTTVLGDWTATNSNLTNNYNNLTQTIDGTEYYVVTMNNSDFGDDTTFSMIAKNGGQTTDITKTGTNNNGSSSLTVGKSYTLKLNSNNKTDDKYTDYTVTEYTPSTTTYTVTAGSCENGKVQVGTDGTNFSSSVTVEANATVYLKATPNDGCTFSAWHESTTLAISDVTSATTTATVKGDTTVKATFSSSEEGQESDWSLAGRFAVKDSDGNVTYTYTDTNSKWDAQSTSIKFLKKTDTLLYVETGYTIKEIAANNNSGNTTNWFLRFYNGTNTYGLTDKDVALTADDANTKTTLKNLSGASSTYGFYFTGNDESGKVVLWLDTSSSSPKFYFTIKEDESNGTKGAYKITTSTGLGGSVTVTGSDDTLTQGTANAGDTITLTTKTNSGYEYKSLTATYEDANGDTHTLAEGSATSYTFTMPANNVTVKAVFNVIKSEAYKSSSNMLWVDVQPSVTTSKTALIKWTNKSGATGNTGSSYALYIPGGVSLTLPVYYSFSSLSIDGTSLNQGDTFTFETGKEYTVNDSYKLKVYKSTSASMYTYTVEGDLPTTTGTTQKTEYTGEFLTIGTNGKVSNDVIAISKIKGRGNSSWEASGEIFGKYAYNIKLESGIQPFKNKEFTKAKSFCLLANNMDESLLRNMVTYQTALSAQLLYTPHFEVADLYNNGEYLGSYLLTEKVDVGSKKLVKGETVEDYHSYTYSDSLKKTATFTYKGETITYSYVDTGTCSADYTKKSYLLEFDLEERAKDEHCWFKTPKGQYIALKSPEDLNSVEMQFIIGKWIDAENAVYANNYTTASTLMDLDSFADVYLVQEFTKNLDSCATSYYVYYDGTQDSPKWQATPIWDYDWALGEYTKGSSKAINTSGENASQDLGNSATASGIKSSTEGWFAKYKYVTQDGNNGVNNTYNLQAQLANMDKFWTDNVKKQWNTDFYSSLVEVFGTLNNTDGYIDSAYTANSASFDMNETRYGFTASHLLSSDKNNWGTLKTGDTMEATYQYLKEWGIKRATWMNEQLSALTGVSVTSNASTYVQGDTITLTATPNPNYVNCTYSYYFTTSETISNNDECMKTTSSDSFSFNATDDGEWYFYVKATDGVTTVTSDPIKLSIIPTQGEHTVTIYFKSPSAAAYAPSVKLNSGSYEPLEKDTLLGKTYSGTLTIYWYKVQLTIDSTKENTLTFKTKRATQKATITDKFNGSTYYLAVDNIINGTKVVDLTNEKEYIRNYYHSAANLVYSSTSESNLGFTNIGGTRYAMGTYLNSLNATASDDDLSMDESVIMPLSASKMVSSVSASSSNSDVTIESATMIQKVVAGLASVSELQTQLFDVDLSGELDIKDATLIQKYLAGY